MVDVRTFIAAGAVALISSAASAADMPVPQVPQIPMQPIPLIVQQPLGGWYLRGDIGVGVLSDANFVFEPNPANAPVDVLSQHASMGDAAFFDLGIGYEFNSWLRFDVTGEYRTKSAMNAFITYQNGGVFGDQYNAFLKSDIFLANAYIDLGTWNCLTPFIGFGIGGAYNTFADLTDLSSNGGNGVGTNASQLNFAWALHAGLAYNVTQNFTVELSYRYLSYGSVSDQIFCFGGCNPDTYKLQNLTSQDFMLGMRWRFPIESVQLAVAAQPVFAPQPVYTPQPLYTPSPQFMPQPQYVPQPQYAPAPQPQYYPAPQPPLQSRG